MKAARKAISMSAEIIVGFVVVLIVAFVLIIFTNGGITKSGKSTQESQDVSSGGIACETQAATWCAQNSEAASCPTDAGSCDKCAAEFPCGRLG